MYCCMRTRTVLFALLLVCALIFTSASLVMASDASYSITTDSEISVPERTETVERGAVSVTIESSKIAVIGPNENLTVETTGPSETTYNVVFVNSQEQQIDSASVEGNAVTDFPAKAESPGSYGVILNDQSLVDDFLPVVIEGYRVDSFTISGESANGASIPANEESNVQVDLNELDSASVEPETVEVVLWNGETNKTYSLEKDTDLTYEGTIEGLDVEEYQAHIRIRGGNSANGQLELIGLSENKDITRASSSDNEGEDENTSGGSDPNGGGGASGGPSSGSSESNETDTVNGTDTTNETDVANETDTTNGTDVANGTDTTSETDPTNGTDTTNNTDTDDSTTGESGTTNGSETDNETDSVISPNGNTEGGETDDSTPLYAVQAVLLGIVLGGGIRRFRRQS